MPADPSLPADAGAFAEVVGVGANAVDDVYRVPGMPAASGPQAKLRIRGRSRSCGGQVTTALCGLRALGHDVAYAGAFGDDDQGALIRRELTARGVNVSHAMIRNTANASAVIVIDDTSGERLVLWDRDERLALRPDELPAPAIRAARLLHTDDVDMAASLGAAAIARDAGVPVTSDIEGTSARTDELIRAVTYPIFAESAVALVTGEQDVERGLRALRSLTSSTLIVTLGERGAVALEGDRLVRVPGFAIRAVDTTGAGDMFRAGFIHAVLAGWAIEATLRFANAVAALSCTRAGAIASAPGLDEVERLLAE